MKKHFNSILCSVFLFLFCIGMCVSPTHATATSVPLTGYAAVHQDITCESEGNTLVGELVRPRTQKKVPLVLMLHGLTSGRNEHDDSFATTAQTLAHMGIASIRFDFAGVGDSEGNFQDMSMLTEVVDAENMLAFAQQLPFVDTNQISVLGMSMGGAVASLLAAEHPDEIYSMCLWAPAGRLVYDARYNWFELLTGGDSHKIVTLWNGYSLSSAFVEDIKTLDFFGIASEYKKDVLLIYGEHDLVMWGGYLETYQDAYPDMRVEMIPNAGHFYEGSAQKQVLQHTIDFFTESGR